MQYRLFVSLLIFLILFVSGQTRVLADEASDFFQQGVAAARSGDNQGAVRAFENAKRAGLASSELYYNLGVIYYRMKGYAWSEDYFNKLTSDVSYAALAYYNLGLIAATKDQISSAIRHFNASYSLTRDPKLKALSEMALRRLGQATKSAAASRQIQFRKKSKTSKTPAWHGLMSLAIARDDNVGLDNDEVKSVTSISEKRDNYAQVLATTHGYISGDHNAGFSLTGIVNAQEYATKSIRDIYDYSQYHVALHRESTSSFWQFNYGIGYDKAMFGGVDFLQFSSVFWSGKRFFHDKKYVRLKLASYKISADPLYQYLDGYKNQMTFDFTAQGSGWKYRLGYIVEISNREDYQTATTYRSYSPLRNTVAVTGFFDFGASWQTRLDLQYRNSSYRSDDVLDSTTNNYFLREDNRYRFAASLIYNFNRHWQSSLDYSYMKNDSNRVDLAGTQLSDYQRNLVSVSLSWFY